MSHIENTLSEIRKAIKNLDNKLWTDYPTLEDVLIELRLRDCDDEEIAYWLGTEDGKLGDVPLKLIQNGNIEAVYRRLRNGRVD